MDQDLADGLKKGMKGLTKNINLGLSMVKKTMAEASSQMASKNPSPTPSNESGARGGQPDANPDSAVLVQYHVQGSEDTENSSFVIAPSQRKNGITVGVVMSVFPLKGNFHFRWKTHDNYFKSVWIDLRSTEDFVPFYKDEIIVKVLRIPENVSLKLTSSPRSPIDNQVGASGSGESPNRSKSPGRGLRARPQAEEGTSPSAKQQQQNWADKSLLEGMSQVDFHGDTSSPSVPKVEVTAPGAVSSTTKASAAAATAAPTPPPPQAYASLPSREELRRRERAEIEANVEAKKKEWRDNLAAQEKKAEDKLDAGSRLQDELDKWSLNPSDGKLKDVRTLLGTIPTVMWPECSYKPVSIPDLMMNQAKVKAAYRNAIVTFHPDRHQNASGDIQYRAERILQAVNEAYKQMS